MRPLRLLMVTVLVSATAAVTFGSGFSAGAAASSEPLWVTHVRKFQGGISNGVRASLDAAVQQAQARHLAAVPESGASSAAAPSASATAIRNVQTNDDSYPPLPQNEESVAASIDRPLVAVAGANDYVSGGTVVMRTSDGGQHWQSTRVVPVFRPTGDICQGGDPAVAYSRREKAFYLAQLCFFRSSAPSEVQVYKSLDNGATWTPGRLASVAASNYVPSSGTVNDTVFNDKEYIAIDNTPTSPHYGRLYVTYTRFHLDSTGASDTCPIKLAYSDSIPSTDPSLATWQHSNVNPDRPSSHGLGESANQFSVPVIGTHGAVDIAYVLEECNSSIDHGLRFQRSTDGGATFLATAIQVNKGLTWVDSPDAADLLPGTAFRAPNTIALAMSPTTGTLAFIYTNYARGRGNGDIEVSLSHNNGLAWTNPVPVSVNPNGTLAANNQFFPWIAVDGTGKYQAIWLDRRADPNNHNITTFQATSTDDGRTWVNFRIGAGLWNPDKGFFKSGAFIGDYSGLAANTTAVYPSWTDGSANAVNQTGTGETDVFTNVELSP
ncbi:MAG: hypothetical protein QOJ71_157 [Actinomycetota bacterium]|nr:hypothetical protein [Actinomycetota bacterium]